MALKLVIPGIILTIIGLSFQNSKIMKVDAELAKSLHIRLNWLSNFFRYIWPIGTTPVALILISTTFIIGMKTGLVVMSAYISIAIIERAIKFLLKRARPYETFPEIALYQPTVPSDPSYPSGDAMRVWFLALVVPETYNLGWPITAASCLIASLLSIGRIALGSHFPLDVIGGIGFGLIGAGLTTLGFQLIPHITIISQY